MNPIDADFKSLVWNAGIKSITLGPFYLKFEASKVMIWA